MRSNLPLRIGLVLVAIGMVFSAIVWTVRGASRPVETSCGPGEYVLRATVNRTEPIYICVRGSLATRAGEGR